jgi:phosphomannomutase/phosphoglucomutase
MGCQVIDIGLTTKPCWRFAVHHLEGAAGIYITGAGCDPAWTGFDLAGRSGIPWSATELAWLEDRSRETSMRPTRQAGAIRSFQAMIPYRAGLRKHFHALRPLRLACGQPGGLGTRWLEQLFAELPCQLVPVPLPVRRRQLDDPADADILRVAECTARDGLDLGLVIDDDGERCGVLDEAGRLLSQEQLVRLLCRRLLRDHPGGTVVVTTDLASHIETTVNALAETLIVTGPDSADLARAVSAEHAVLGAGSDQRCWFDEDYPACDAVLTLAAVLQAMSWSDAPLSEVAR